MQIEVVQGDITEQGTDAVVNAANSDLTNGTGVNGAIHAAAGPELSIVLRTLGGCPTGNAVITPGFSMACRYIIHAVGPIWHGGSMQEDKLLTQCYKSCMKLANDNCLESIAFPAISTGVYGYPLALATPIAIAAVKSFDAPKLVRFVVFDEQSYDRYVAEVG